MTTTSKTKSHFERVQSKTHTNGFHTNNQQKCIDCFKPRSKKK